MHDIARELFEEQIAAYEAKAVGRLMKSFAEDAVLQDMSQPDAPYVGKDQIETFLVEYFSHLADVRTAITSLATAGDTALGEIEVTARYMPDPGKPDEATEVLLRYCLADSIRDGKITRERFYWDVQQLERQLSRL